MTTVPLPLRPFPLLLALATLAACSGATEPPDEIREQSELNILRLPANHPPFFNDSVAFYVKTSRGGEGKIYFQAPGGGRGEAFAELKLEDRTLLARADGTPFGAGDSVLIVMKVADQSDLLVELRPTGIRFRASEPAELKLDYEATGGDIDGDGDRDGEDAELELRLSIWRQARIGDPFVKIGTVKTEGLRELEAKLTSFSRYAIAY